MDPKAYYQYLDVQTENDSLLPDTYHPLVDVERWKHWGAQCLQNSDQLKLWAGVPYG